MRLHEEAEVGILDERPQPRETAASGGEVLAPVEARLRLGADLAGAADSVSPLCSHHGQFAVSSPICHQTA